MPEGSPLIVVTRQGTIHTLLGPDGPIPYSVVDVAGGGLETSPYRIQTVIPRRAYVVRGPRDTGDQEVSADDIAAIKRFALPGDIQVKDRVLVRDADKTWRKEEHEVVGVVDHFEYVLRNDEGDTCAVVLDHNILAVAPPKPVKKPKKKAEGAAPGRRGRPAGAVQVPAALTPATAPESPNTAERQEAQTVEPATAPSRGALTGGETSPIHDSAD